MRDLTLVHKYEMDLLKFFMKICAEYNLKYTMLGGTMLGAIRHKGFIPWDDDIDIGMPRRDYEYFIKIIQKQNIEGLYLNYFPNQDTYIVYPIKLENTEVNLINKSGIEERIVNVWIDIFPLDGMPNNAITRKIHKSRLLICRALMQLAQFKFVAINYSKRPFIENAIIKIAKCFPWMFKNLDNKYYANKIDKLLKKYNLKDSKYIVNFMGAYKFKEMFPSEIYTETEMYQFEDVQLPGPKNYDFYLKQLYGDYMKPPADNDKNKHCTEVIE